MPSSACDWSSDVCSSDRSEEHTSELQSRSDLVCRLLLEKKKTVEECLRYAGPVPATVEVATEHVPWHARTVRRGAMVVPFLDSANPDPRQFPHPDTFDVP